MVQYILRTRNLFMGCMCTIYMFAFGSLYLQIQGLYGNNGILPAKSQIPKELSSAECFYRKKTLLCFSSSIGLDVPIFMEFLALLGTVLSFTGLVWGRWRSSILFFLLWVFYLSVYQVGQTFLWFQWDILLLEVGFLTIMVAPLISNVSFKYHPRNIVTLWLVKWCLFRLMFASGVVKLQSDCPTWWGLTALNHHFESQCIPTPLSWFAHQLPEWWQKLCVAATLVIEIPVPFMFFSPIKEHKLFAFYAQAFLQISIILTGNYNFFNLTTLCLCLSLVDDNFLGYKTSFGIPSGVITTIKSLVYWAFKWIGFGLLAYLCLVYFSLKLAPGGVIDSNIGFSKNEFSGWVSKAVPFAVGLGFFSLLITVAECLTTCLFEVRGGSKKTSYFLTTLFYSALAFIMFGISLVPFTSLDRTTQTNIWPVFKELHASTQDVHLSSSYGLFRRMTGVGGRPEVVLEGSNNLDGPWKEFEFPSKPGSVDRSPAYIIPHQPRVDWQLWFAALGSYNQNPWIVSMTYRLLLGEKSVVNFLDKSSPWRDSPPKYIRGVKYTYSFTTLDDPSGNWWTRKNEGEYMPIFSADHGPLKDYLQKMSLLIEEEKPKKSSCNCAWLKNLLALIRNLVSTFEPHFVLWSLFTAAILIIYTRNEFFNA